MQADHEYDDTMLVPLQSASAGMRSRSVRNPFIYTRLIRLDSSNTISNFTHRYLRPVYPNDKRIDMMNMINVHASRPISCLNGRTAGGQYSCPIRNCFRLRCEFSWGLFVSSCLCIHAARPRALSPRDKPSRTLCPFLPLFVSVFPIE